MVVPADPVLTRLAIEGRRLSQGSPNTKSITTHVRPSNPQQIPPLPQSDLEALRGFVPSTLPKFTGGGYDDVEPIPCSPYEWACHLEGACVNYALHAKDLWNCRPPYLGSRWEKALVSPYNQSGRSWRVVSILEDQSRLVHGCILHHRQRARFPGIGDGGSGLLLGEQECAFALLGRQRATANILVRGRVRITSVTDTAIRVLEAILDDTTDPIAVSFHILKTTSLDHIREDEYEWLHLVYLTMHKQLTWKSDGRARETKAPRERLRPRVVSEDLGFSGPKQSDDSYSSSVSSSL